MYRPVCRTHLCDVAGGCSPACSCHARLLAPVVPCEMCGRQLSYTAAPERRGLWRDRLAVCSLGCLNEAKSYYDPAPAPPPDPPSPRPCAWCGDQFQPRRLSTAKYCGPACRQRASRRARSAADLSPVLLAQARDVLGVDLVTGERCETAGQRALREAFADALDA